MKSPEIALNHAGKSYIGVIPYRGNTLRKRIFEQSSNFKFIMLLSYNLYNYISFKIHRSN